MRQDVGSQLNRFGSEVASVVARLWAAIKVLTARGAVEFSKAVSATSGYVRPRLQQAAASAGPTSKRLARQTSIAAVSASKSAKTNSVNLYRQAAAGAAETKRRVGPHVGLAAGRGASALGSVGRHGSSVLQRSGHGLVVALQRAEVRLKGIDRRKLLIGTGAVVAVMAVAAIVPALSRDRASTTQAASDVELAPAFVLERISNGRNGNFFALVAGQPLFPLPPSSLNAFDRAPVEMQDAPVHSVVSETGMWVGATDDQRVFVTMKPEAAGTGSLTPANFKPGDTLNLSGRMAAASGFDKLGVTPANGADQLFAQGFLVEAVSVRGPTGPPAYANR